jgi:hypothetical protein
MTNFNRRRSDDTWFNVFTAVILAMMLGTFSCIAWAVYTLVNWLVSR